MEIRSAISLSRAAVRATSRLATLEQAMSSTRRAIVPTTHSGRSKSCLILEGPFAADRRWTGALTKRSILSRGSSAGRVSACSRRTLVETACRTARASSAAAPV
jgi:hypothetical protein